MGGGGEADAMIQRLSLVPRLNAMGFFELGRSTLTSVFSTIATYLFILIQFEQSDTTYKTS